MFSEHHSIWSWTNWIVCNRCCCLSPSEDLKQNHRTEMRSKKISILFYRISFEVDQQLAFVQPSWNRNETKFSFDFNEFSHRASAATRISSLRSPTASSFRCNLKIFIQWKIQRYSNDYLAAERLLHFLQMQIMIIIMTSRTNPPTEPEMMIKVLKSAKGTKMVFFSFNQSSFLTETSSLLKIWFITWRINGKCTAGKTFSRIFAIGAFWQFQTFVTRRVRSFLAFLIGSGQNHIEQDRTDHAENQQIHFHHLQWKSIINIFQKTFHSDFFFVYCWDVFTINFNLTSHRNVDFNDFSDSMLINLMASPWFFNKAL